jgi:4-diphosphocytidyl-2-C-methyl-D-erythritol kinase
LKHKGDLPYLSTGFAPYRRVFLFFPVNPAWLYKKNIFGIIGLEPMGRVRCHIKAPAKINLHLRVGGRSADGYHDLESVFVALDFGDSLVFDLPGFGKAGETELSAEMKLPLEWSVGLEKNLVYRAAALFRERTGFDSPLRIRLEKRIPWGAGLGGGSSDAAAALAALDALAETGLSREALGEMAEELGSDVPFFLGYAGPAALVNGRGERLRPLAFPGGLSVVLVYPGFESGTAGAFRLLDETRGADFAGELPAGEDRYRTLAAALEETPAHWRERGIFGNDFLPVLLRAGPERDKRAYREILADLDALGADFSGLTGSGSTCFGIFYHQGAAEAAVKALGDKWFFVQPTFSLARWGMAVLQ